MVLAAAIGGVIVVGIGMAFIVIDPASHATEVGFALEADPIRSGSWAVKSIS